MRFRYMDSEGKEVPVEDVPALVRLIQHGDVAPETLLFDSLSARWTPARKHDVFRASGRLASPTGESAPGMGDPGAQDGALRTPDTGGTPEVVREGEGGLEAQESDPTAQGPEKEDGRPWLFRKPGIAITTVLVGVVSLLTAPVSPDLVPESIGSVAGLFVGALLFPALVLIWTSSTRRYIPIAGLALLLFAKVLPLAMQPRGCDSLATVDDRVRCEVIVERYRAGQVGLGRLIRWAEDEPEDPVVHAAIETIRRRFLR